MKWLFIILFLLITIVIIFVIKKIMLNSRKHDKSLVNLPDNAAEFIKQIIKKMRYRRSVRKEVKQELADHFEDELAEYQTEIKEEKAKILIEEFGDTKMLAVLLRRAKKRCRPVWQTVIIRAFQFVGILLVIHIVMFFVAEPEVTVNYIEKINQLGRPKVDENLNARIYYDKSAELYVSMPNDLKVDKTYGDLPKYFVELDPNLYPLLEKWLDKNKQAFELVEEGSTLPHYWRTYEVNEPNQSLLEIQFHNLTGYKHLAIALMWRVQYSAKKGDVESAFNDIFVCYRFASQLNNSTILIDQLVGISFYALSLYGTRDLLAEYDLDDALLENVFDELQQLVANSDYRITMDFERFLIYDEIQRIYSPSGLIDGRMTYEGAKRWSKLLGDSPDFSITIFLSMFVQPDREQTAKKADEIFDYYQQISEKSPAQLHAENRSSSEIEKMTEKMTEKNFFLRTLTPHYWKVHQLSYKAKTGAEATLAVIALVRYKKQFGHYPQNLRELVDKGLLSQLPIDYFSDKPLVYRRSGDNFILYSIGEDFEDDGGVEKQHRDEGDFIFWPVKD